MTRLGCERVAEGASGRWRAVAGVAAVVVVMAGGVRAQPAGQPTTPAAEPDPNASEISTRAPSVIPWPAVSIEQAMAQPTPIDGSYLVRMLERLTLLDLRLQSAPTVDDFRFAEVALEIGARATDNDADIWRSVVEAAFNAGDRGALERATRRVVELDPQDTVAQLRLVTMRLGRLQTREERMAAYERLLGPAGGSIDASVRSRLALDAAVLAREGGDSDGFARLLTLSTSLDPSHKEAAALALAYFQASAADDPLGRMQLLCNLLMADPLDPHVHLAIAEELSRHGAFAQAARFHNNARNIIGASDPAIAEELDLRGLILIWQLQGPERVVTELDRRLANLRHEAAYDVAVKESRGIAVRDEDRPENTRLTREYDLLRLVAADAAGMRDVAALASKDMTATAMAVVSYYQRPENQPTGEEGRILARQIIDMWLETLVVRAWAAGDMESLSQDLQITRDRMSDAIDLSEPMAWYALRTGQLAPALEFFEATQGDRYRSPLGLALYYETAGRRSEAAEQYAKIAREDPLTVQSAWARSRLLFMTGQDLARTEWADRVSAIADGVPPALDRMLVEAQEFMRLELSAPRTQIGPMEIGRVSLVLANRSSFALGVGSDRPIDARFLMSPELRVGGTPVIGGVQPEVFDLDRRLRLTPGEEVSATLWPDSGFTGVFIASQAASRTGLMWRAIQGFRIVNEAYVRGPLCLSDATQEVYREPLLMARLSPADLERAIREAPADRLAALAQATFAVCMSLNYGQSVTPEQAAGLASAMRERYVSADPATRALLLAILPHGILVDGFAAFDDGVRSTIASETDPMVLLLALMTRAHTADDPVIAACRASSDPGLGELAEIQAERLAREGGPVYANAGPGMAALMGPVIPSLRGVAE